MTTGGLPTIRELLADAAGALPEPFSRAALISWVRARRPDVAESSVAAHIQAATARPDAPEDARDPLLLRVGRGQYRAYRGPVVDVPAEPSGERVVLIGSGGAAAAVPVRARELFDLAGFVRARDAVAASGQRWFVLSAKHGLLDPDDVVGPFDISLGDQTVDYRITWGEWVAAQLAARMPLAGVTVEVHGGVDFASPLRKALARHGATVELPLSSFWRGEDPVVAFEGNVVVPPPAEPPAPRTALRRLRGFISR